MTTLDTFKGFVDVFCSGHKGWTNQTANRQLQIQAPSIAAPPLRPPPVRFPGAAGVMQRADLKSIDLSPSFERDVAGASSLPLPSRGSTAGFCLLPHTLYVLRSVGLRRGEWQGSLSGSR